jgi:phage minor structural protein, N-terminal domain protein|nr:MAG TPA: tail protein [Caudoviricetes sp.]
MRPILFNKNETAFDTYGLGELNVTKGTVTRERNGNYTLYSEIPANDPMVATLEKEMKLKADAGLRTKNQTFEISRIVKDSSNIVKIYGQHISHKLEYMGLVNGRVFSGSAFTALAIWHNATIGDLRFDVWSDIQTTGKGVFDISKMENARQALGGVEGSILDIYGGEYEFDNMTVRLHKQLGRTAPTVLEYGRNILSAELDETIESAYTSVLPFATYTPDKPEGDTSDSQPDPVTVTLPENYVDSKYKALYAHRRIKVVDFSSEFKSDSKSKDIPTPDKLRKIANDYMERNEIGKPKINIKIEYADLARTLDYADRGWIEEVELCDIVPVYYPQIGLTDETLKITTITYDFVNERNESVEFGDIGTNVRATMQSGLAGRVDDIAKAQQDFENSLPDYLLNAQGNKVWYNRPDDKEHKIGDIWFEKNGLYDRMYVWNGSQWEKRIDTEDVDKIKKEVNRQLEEAKTTTDRAIEEANAKAREALEKAGTLPNTDSLSAKIKEEILKSKDLSDKINRTFTENDNGTEIFNKISGEVTKKLVEVKGQVDQKITQTNQRIGEMSGSVNSSLYSMNNRLGEMNNGLNKAKIDIVNAQGTADNVGNKLILTNQKVDQANNRIDQTGRDLANTNAQVEANKRQIEVQVTNYNAVRESTKLFERILGTTEEGAPDKLSRLVMSSDIFQTEVGKYVTDDNNLIVNSMTMDKNTLVVNNNPNVNVSVADGIFTIKAQDLTGYNWSGFTLPIYVKKIYRGETYTLGFKYRIREYPDVSFAFNIKNHGANKALTWSNIGENRPPLNEWQEFQKTFTMQEDFAFGEDKNYPFYIFLAKNGWIEFKEPILVRGSNTGPYKPSQFDDAFAETRSLESQITSKIGEVSSATDSVRQLAYMAQNRAEQAASRSSSALDKAEDAKMDATKATSLSQTAKQTALDAQQKAIEVAEQARQAQATAEATRTQVTQLAGSWAVRNLNSAGDVIGQINLNKDGSVKINESLIVIGENTYIKNGVIKSSMIEDLTADKIGAGRIDAEVVNIVNLNAESVTSGTFRGLTFEGGIIRGNNGNTVINLNSNVTTYNGTAKIEFMSPYNTLEFSSGGRKAFLAPTVAAGTKHAAFAFGVNDHGYEDPNKNFVGFKIFNSFNNRRIYMIGDVHIVKDSVSDNAPAKSLAELFYYIDKNFKDLRDFRVAHGEGSPGFYDVRL